MSMFVWCGILAYLCFALAAIGDKVILSRHLNHPIAYAFYVGLFSPIVLILSPFGFHWLGVGNTAIALLGGVCFIYALIYFYRAISQSTASSAATIVGGFEPIFVLTLAFFIVGEHLSKLQLSAFVLLLIGSVLISLEKVEKKWVAKAIWNCIVAALLFAAGFAFFKYTYNHTNFISGLIWTRTGLFVGAMSFLILPSTRKIIFSKHWSQGHSGKFVFLGNFLLGASGSLLQNYAISLGSVSIVSAMAGVQFVFLLAISSFLSRYFPKVLHEDLRPSILIQKIFAIILISTGIVLINL
jgi:drug/metabolite transporter (DMT)-like permease